MQLINFHLADKVTLVIIFTKHPFIIVVIFRNNDQRCSYKIFFKMFQLRLSAKARCVEIPLSINIRANYI